MNTFQLIPEYDTHKNAILFYVRYLAISPLSGMNTHTSNEHKDPDSEQ